MATNIKPEKTPEQKVAEEIAENLTALATAVQKLVNGPLNKKALTVLLAASSGLSRTQVVDVLNALENLKKDWLK